MTAKPVLVEIKERWFGCCDCADCKCRLSALAEAYEAGLEQAAQHLIDEEMDHAEVYAKEIRSLIVGGKLDPAA